MEDIPGKMIIVFLKRAGFLLMLTICNPQKKTHIFEHPILHQISQYFALSQSVAQVAMATQHVPLLSNWSPLHISK